MQSIFSPAGVCSPPGFLFTFEGPSRCQHYAKNFLKMERDHLRNSVRVGKVPRQLGERVKRKHPKSFSCPLSSDCDHFRPTQGHSAWVSLPRAVKVHSGSHRCFLEISESSVYPSMLFTSRLSQIGRSLHT